MTCEADDVKRQASGRWLDILLAAGLPSEVLDGRGHPCPKCEGTDRFTVFKDCDQTGGVMCRQCFNSKNGDGFAAVMWLQGCSFPEAVAFVAERLRLPDGDVCPAPKTQKRDRPKQTWPTSRAAIAALEKKRGACSAAWTYRYADGGEAGAVVRWNRPDGDKYILPIAKVSDGWQCVAMAEPRPLYRLPDVLQADVVYVTEGEKAADAGVSIGLNVTTSPGGCQAPARADWSPLAGKDVVIIPDNDDAGEKYTETVAGILTQLDPPATVRIVDLSNDWPDLPDKGDLADWIDAHDAVEPETLRERIEALIAKAEPWQPCPSPVQPSPAQPQASQISLLDLPDEDEDWPAPLEPEAFHGLAGEFIGQVLPDTEAGEAALLFHFLTYVGAMMGRARYFPVSGTRHHCRLFSVAVGGTSSGRKGTALDCVSHVMRLVDADGGFRDENVVSGLTSGAGLVWQVRDGDDSDAVTDKRLLVIESEFGAVLRVSQRKENDLSAVLRDGWDGKTLRSLGKQQPAKATDPHICLIGHVTREELRATMSKVDKANGFANRILWYGAKRSKLLPDGGQLDRRDLRGLTTGLLRAITFAQRPGPMVRTDRARGQWHDVYASLTAGRPGIFGQVTTRAEAQVLRLSMLYALLDESAEIDEPHIAAALAVWKYSEVSARWAFGGSLGNRVADEILLALRDVAPRGLSSTELSGLFNRNKGSSEIREALNILSRCGLIRRDEPKGNSPGRPAVVFYST